MTLISIEYKKAEVLSLSLIPKANMKTTRIGNYKVVRQIGKGGLGKVYLAVHEYNKTQVAIKKINQENGVLEERALNELEVLKKFKSSEYFVNLIESFTLNGSCFMVMEFLAGCDLFDFVTTNILSEDVIKYIFLQLLKGVKQLHECGIVHHDLKLENILIGKNGKIKLIDFNLCCFVSGDCKISKFCGTEAYLAPELFPGEPYNGKKIDIWCLGVILFTMCWKQFPFMPENNDLLYEQTRNKRYLPCMLKHLNGSEELKHLVLSILNPDPIKRISLEDILIHPWLQSASPDSYQRFLFEEELCNRVIEGCRC